MGPTDIRVAQQYPINLLVLLAYCKLPFDCLASVVVKVTRTC